MRCESVTEALSAARDGAGELDAVAREHLEGCAACRAFSANLGRLDRVLAADEVCEPRPGFDSRFFARVERRRRGRRWSWTLAAVGVPVVAAAALLLLLRPGPTVPLREDLELAMNLDLVENMALLRRLEEVEAYEALSQVDLAEIESVIGGEP